MKDCDIDKELKALLSDDDKIKIPHKISVGIEATLRQIRVRRARQFSIRKGAIAAALICALTLGVVSVFPALAGNIPIINKVIGENSLFNRFSAQETTYLHFLNLNEARNYAIAVDQTIEGITVKELAYDGVAFYTVWEIIDASAEAMDNIHKYRSSIIVNDTLEVTAGVFIPERLNVNTIRVIQVYPIPGDTVVPDEILASITFDKGDGAQKSQVSLKLSKDQLLASVKKVELNSSVKLGSTSAKLLSMTQSPVYTSLTIDFSKYEPNKYDFVMLDDKGNEMQEVDMGRMTTRGNNTILTKLYKTTDNGNVDSIMIIGANAKNSYKELNSHSPSALRTKKYVELNTQLPSKVRVGNSKNITVTSIIKEGENLRIVINTKGLAINTYIRMGGLSLYNQTHNGEYQLSLAEALGDNNYLLTYNRADGFDLENAVLCFGDYDELLTVLYEFTAH